MTYSGQLRGHPQPGFIFAMVHIVFLSQASSNKMDTIFWAAFEPVPLDSTVLSWGTGPLHVPQQLKPIVRSLETSLTAPPSTPPRLIALPTQVVCTAHLLDHQHPSHLVPVLTQ